MQLFSSISGSPVLKPQILDNYPHSQILHPSTARYWPNRANRDPYLDARCVHFRSDDYDDLFRLCASNSLPACRQN
jgi:hypothetical protein